MHPKALRQIFWTLFSTAWGWRKIKHSVTSMASLAWGQGRKCTFFQPTTGSYSLILSLSPDSCALFCHVPQSRVWFTHAIGSCTCRVPGRCQKNTRKWMGLSPCRIARQKEQLLQVGEWVCCQYSLLTMKMVWRNYVGKGRMAVIIVLLCLQGLPSFIGTYAHTLCTFGLFLNPGVQ